MNVRRVVTGHDRSGKSVFLSDEAVEPLSLDVLAGLAFHKLWAQDAPPAIPAAGICEAWSTYFPPVGGVRFVITTFPPEAAAQPAGDLDVAAALAELEQKLPGLAEHMEPDDPACTPPTRSTSTSSSVAS